jgi:hypothetical protein
LLSISPWHVEYFRGVLVTNGFRDVGFLQIWKRGQVFGYARPYGAEMEWHVRAFANGTLESELESPRNTIGHLLKPLYLSDGLLAQLLSRHRIPFWNGLNTSTRRAHPWTG